MAGALPPGRRRNRLVGARSGAEEGLPRQGHDPHDRPGAHPDGAPDGADALVAAAKDGNGAKLAEELFRFITETNAAITDADERKAIHGSEEYSSFMSMATDLLFSLHPDIAGGVHGLEAAARDRLFDEAGTLTTDKSREIQQQRRDGLDLAQAQALALGAKHWSSANACLLQLQQEIQA